MAMKPTTKRIVRLALLGIATGAAAGLAAGCQNRPEREIHGEMFPADEDVRPVDRMVEAQSAAAARADATLNAYHFDRSAALNSLGRSKIDLMLRDDEDALPLVVYLDVRDAAGSLDRHRDAVRHYLADRGVADEQVEFREGPNLEFNRPARDGLRGLNKLQGQADALAGPADAMPPTGTAGLTGDPTKK